MKASYHIYGFNNGKKFGPHDFGLLPFYKTKEEAIKLAKEVADNLDKYDVPKNTAIIVKEEKYDGRGLCVSSKEIWSSLLGLNEYEVKYYSNIVCYVIKDLNDNQYLTYDTPDCWTDDLDQAEAFENYEDAVDKLDDVIREISSEVYPGDTEEDAEKRLDWDDENRRYFKVIPLYADKLHESKLVEKFEKLTIKDVEDIAKKDDPELLSILNSPLKSLPDSFKYSFDREEWDEACESEKTYIDFLKELSKKHKDFDFIVSRDNGKVLGWMAYSPVQGLVGNIKFGSLTNDVKDNVKLLFDCKEQLTKFLRDYLTVMWFACEDNKKVYNYCLNLVDEYNKKGFDAGIQKTNDYEFFYISRANKYIESISKNKESKMKESFTLEVFDKNGKVIDYQEGFKTPSEARGFLSYNDDKYPAGYDYKIRMKESFTKNENEITFPGDDLHSKLCEWIYSTADYYDLQDACEVGENPEEMTWNMSDKELVEAIIYTLNNNEEIWYNYTDDDPETSTARKDGEDLVKEYKYRARQLGRSNSDEWKVEGRLEKHRESKVKDIDVSVDFPISVNNKGRVSSRDAKKLLKYLAGKQMLKSGNQYFIKDSEGKSTCWFFIKSMDPYFAYEFSCEVADEGIDDSGERDYYNCLYIPKSKGKLDLKNAEWESYKV